MVARQRLHSEAQGGMSTEQEAQIQPHERVTRYVVRTLMGLEPQVVSELEEHGAVEVELGRRSASFGATKATLYGYLQSTRFAVRVLRPVFEFKAKVQEQSQLWVNAVLIYRSRVDNPRQAP